MIGTSFMCVRIIVLAIVATIPLSGCAKPRETSPTHLGGMGPGVEHLIAASRDAAHRSMRESNRSKAKEEAERGVEFAERCLKLTTLDPGCYYWRAINTGLYYRAYVVGYQRGVKKMIDDCKKVISLNDNYDQAGAYRVLGEIYTQLPQTGGTADSVTRDLDLAEKYLRQAVLIAPDYPENHLALAEMLFAKEKPEEALEAIAQAKGLVHQWRHDISYDDWRKTMLALEKKIGKMSK